MDTIKLTIGGESIEVSKDDITKGLEAGSVEVKSDEVVVYGKDAFEAFKTNLAKQEYKNGKIKGNEMLIKDSKEKFGLEFEGKTLENFADAFKARIEADSKIEPSKKIQELQADNDKLRQNYTQLENDFSGFKSQISEKETRSKKDSFILSALPENGLKVGSKIAMLALKTEAGIDIDYVDGQTVVTKNGQVVKDDKTLQPVEPNAFISEQISLLGLMEKGNPGGGGGDDTGAKNETSYDKFVKEMGDKGINENSLKFNQEMNKRMSDGTLKLK